MKNMKERISRLFKGQKLGVLATLDPQYPYQSVVAFAATDDLKRVLFATRRPTRKYENLKRNAKVSVFIDNRSNRVSDFKDAVGVTALGDARELKGGDFKKYSGFFKRKHPYLGSFLSSPDCALFAVKVRVYYTVVRFEDVVEIRP